MSGHSHWHSIKYKKSLTDAKKSKIFSKVAREITLAAREGGGSPEFNSKLRLVIETARSLNMPADNIEKSVKRGTGEIQGEILEPFLFEAYGPGNIAVLIEGITDNKNRSLGEIKQIINRHHGKMVAEGAVRWMFEKKCCLALDLQNQNEELKDKEKLELAAIEAGALDIYWHDNFLDVYTKTEDLERVKKNLEDRGIKIDSTSLEWAAKEIITLDEKQKEEAEKLFEALDENETVQEIYSNLKI